MTREQRRLRINGRAIPVVCNQMLIDFSDFDLSIPLPTPPARPSKMKRPVCCCGGAKCGYKDYMYGHYDWCDVHMDKTPVSVNNPFYESK